MKPRYSIVVESLNQGAFLSRALDSLFAQSNDHDHLEIIVVDAGSTDGSVEIIRERSSRLAWWCSEPDGGPAAGLNKGFAHARGEWLGYLNADDELAPGALDAIDSARGRDDADVLFGDIAYINAVDAPTRFPNGRRGRFRATDFDPAFLRHGLMVIPQQGSMWTRALYDRVGGFVPENRTCWDFEFFVDAFLLGARFRRVPGILGRFRLHGDSISMTNRGQEHRVQDHARIDAKLAEHFRCHPVDAGRRRTRCRYLWQRCRRLLG